MKDRGAPVVGHEVASGVGTGGGGRWRVTEWWSGGVKLSAMEKGERRKRGWLVLLGCTAIDWCRDVPIKFQSLILR